MDRANGQGARRHHGERRAALHGRHVRGDRATGGSRPRRSRASIRSATQPTTITQRGEGAAAVGRSNDDDQLRSTRRSGTTRRARCGEAYANEGYIYANVRPVVERVTVGADSVPTVNLRWEIDEGTPAIVNRVEITGNDITSESCIRDQIFVAAGRRVQPRRADPQLPEHRQPRLLRDAAAARRTRSPANDQGDVDIIFHVKEKRTGNVNFGASVGQGAGRRRLHRLRPAEPVRPLQARLAASGSSASTSTTSA